MDRLLYTALSGLRRAEFAQATTAHNLANAQTAGFRRDRSLFESALVAGDVYQVRVQAAAARSDAELEGGPVTQTGRPLDVALAGAGMIAVEPSGGGEAYTRRGDLILDSAGTLRTGDGRAVLGEGGPITVPPAEQVQIAPDGTVLYRAPGDAPDAPLAEAGRIKLVAAAPGALVKAEDGLFRTPGGQPAAADPAIRLQSGALEGANITPVAAMVELIEQSRAFEMQTKLVGEAREMDRASTSLIRLEN